MATDYSSYHLLGLVGEPSSFVIVILHWFVGVQLGR